jgi:hypothetical protein
MRRVISATFWPTCISVTAGLLIERFSIEIRCDDWMIPVVFFATSQAVSLLIYHFSASAADLTKAVFGCISVRLLLMFALVISYSTFNFGSLLPFAMHMITPFVSFVLFEGLYLKRVSKKS